MGLLTKQAATPTAQAQLFSAQPFQSGCDFAGPRTWPCSWWPWIEATIGHNCFFDDEWKLDAGSWCLLNNRHNDKAYFNVSKPSIILAYVLSVVLNIFFPIFFWEVLLCHAHQPPAPDLLPWPLEWRSYEMYAQTSPECTVLKKLEKILFSPLFSLWVESHWQEWVRQKTGKPWPLYLALPFTHH